MCAPHLRVVAPRRTPCAAPDVHGMSPSFRWVSGTGPTRRRTWSSVAPDIFRCTDERRERRRKLSRDNR
jgi:hypothetical protein